VFRQSNLVRRKRTFYFRARVPTALIATLGRRELWRSLRTSDPVLARLRASVMWASVQKLWNSVLSGSVTKEEIDQLLREWLSQALASDMAARSDTSFAVGHEAPGESIGHAAGRMLHSRAEDSLFYWRDEVCAHSEWEKAAPYLNVFLQQRGLSLDRESEDYRLLCMGIALAQRDFHGVCVERSQGRTPERSDVALFDSPLREAQETSPKLPSLPPAPSLCAAMNDFLDEKGRRGELKPKRRMDFKAAFALLTRRVDPSTAVNRVSPIEIGQLRTLLTKLPRNFTKLYGARDLDEVVADAATKGLHLLGTETINQKYLGLIEQFFEWCVSCGHIKDNPAASIRVKASASSSAEDKRGTFGLDELKLLFTAPLFVGCKSAGRIHLPGRHRVEDYRYWLPLLGLFTGARLNELCQLQTADIREIEGVPCIDVSPANGRKSIKSKAGARKIPIHPELLALGFLGFSKQRKEQGCERVFPELEMGVSGYFSDNASKWFGRFLEITLGERLIAERALVFHSFRHAMKDALRRAKVDERIQDALIGHETDHVSATYGEGYKPPELLGEISKVTYWDLDLSHLHLRHT
jgi:integrase